MHKTVALIALFCQSFVVTSGEMSSDTPNHLEHTPSLTMWAANQSFAARLAAFGPNFDDSFKGQLMKVCGDTFGCQKPTHVQISIAKKCEIEGKILLLQRGNCSYTTQIRQMQKMGSIGVIVGDNAPRNWLFKISAHGTVSVISPADPGDTSDILIPSASISLTSYESLSSLLTVHSSVDFTVVGSPTLDLTRTDIILLLASLLTFVCIWVVVVLRSNYSTYLQKASLVYINSLPTRRWMREKHHKTVAGDISSAIISPGYHAHSHHEILLKCVICLEDFADGDIVMTLPCDHDFHKACV